MTPQQFLGNELARARLAAGFSSQQVLADHLGFDRTVITKVETGDRPPSFDVLAKWAVACHVDAELFGRLSEFARSADGPVPQWFETWLEAEKQASMLKYWQPTIVPAIAQIPEYRRALVTATGNTAERTDELITALAERQAGVFDRPEPPDVQIVVDEVILHRLVGSPGVMHEQLQHLAELSDRPRVCVQVVPSGIGANAGLSGPVNLASGNDMPDVLHVDGTPEGHTTETRSLVREATVIYERLRGDAMPRVLSRDLIVEVANDRWKI